MRFEENINIIEKKIGYTFKDKSLLKQAFTRTSFCNEQKGRVGAYIQSNEVLEFFGDSVLSTAIITLLMKDLSKRYDHGIKTDLSEGDFSNIRSKLSDKSNLSRSIANLGLESFLLMGEGDSKNGIAKEPSVMEDLFESIIGAIYIDSDMNLKSVILSVSLMLDLKCYTESKGEVIQSYKNALQEWCASKAHRHTPPSYEPVSESGPEHKKVYVRACYIDGRLYATGEGKNQKAAESAAAEAALKILMQEDSKESTSKSICEEEALRELKRYAKEHTLPSPEFRDLGETLKSTKTQREYEIECRLGANSAKGVGPGKKEAKIEAVIKLYELLFKKSSETKTNAQKNESKKNIKAARSTKKNAFKEQKNAKANKKTQHGAHLSSKQKNKSTPKNKT